MNEVKKALQEAGVRTFVVDAKPGESFGEQTSAGLFRAAAMVAFCTSQYGERTGAGYETYEELKHAHESNGRIYLIPLKLNRLYPPQPPDADGRALCQLVFSRSKVFINGVEEQKGVLHRRPAEQVAAEIRQALKGAGKLQLVEMKEESLWIEEKTSLTLMTEPGRKDTAEDHQRCCRSGDIIIEDPSEGRPRCVYSCC